MDYLDSHLEYNTRVNVFSYILPLFFFSLLWPTYWDLVYLCVQGSSFKTIEWKKKGIDS